MDNGFLTQLLVLLLLFMLLLLGCGKGGAATTDVPTDPAAARVHAAGAMLEHVVKATTKFYDANKRVPKSVDELVAARALHIQKSADPWGQVFVLSAAADASLASHAVQLCSSGEDMAVGTEDDICKSVTLN